MGLLVVLTTVVVLASVAATLSIRSRAEGVVAASLVFVGIVVAPSYVFGLTNHLTRATLGGSAMVVALGILGVQASRLGPLRAMARIGERLLAYASLPFEGIAASWKQRSLLTVGAALAAGFFPYMLLVAYLAPTWRDWDGLWYHEPVVGFTIQNHGFAPIPLPMGLQVINGVHRLGELTDLWFAIFAGRRVVEMGNVVTMPLYAASVFVLVRRFTRDVVSGVAWASAMILLPAYLRLVQSTLCDPESAGLLLAAAWFVTHRRLDRVNAGWAILALTLAVGIKIWSIVPCAIFSVVLLVRLVRRAGENGRAATAGLILLGAAAVVGMQATVYVRNLLLFHNPVWPILQYDNPKLGIHWQGLYPVDLEKNHAGINFNDPWPVMIKKMLAAPYAVLGPGPTWQVNDYGFAWSWVVLPVCVLVVLWVTVAWCSSMLQRGLRRRAPATPADDDLGVVMLFAFTAVVSMVSSPAIFIARYHIPSLGMLVACLAWAAARSKRRAFLTEMAFVAQVGSLMMGVWGPSSTRWVYLFEPKHIVRWLKTPYPRREFEDIGTAETPKLGVSPVNTQTATARDRELGPGDVIAYDSLEYVSLLWNNDYSNVLHWVSSNHPLAEAEAAGAKWIYTKPGSVLHAELTKNHAWQMVGPLEMEGFGNAWRRRP